MSRYFAEIKDGVVQRVVVADTIEWCKTHLGGEWHETFLTSEGHQYAGVVYSYDSTTESFITPRPFPSWTLGENKKWTSPIPHPVDGESYWWDEAKKVWARMEEVLVVDCGGVDITIE